MKLNSIQDAIEDIKNGKIIIVVDDEDRENEGDFLAAAELVTPEIINFMTLHGRGLICTPIPEQRCKELGLELMVGNNTDPNETAFTISIDLMGNGISTGISAADRAKTILAMMDPNTKPYDFAKPGHVFPLIAKSEGVLRRPGHTEAAVDLSRLAGLKPGGVIVEIMNEDGTMARLPQLFEIAKKFNLKIISIKDLIDYRQKIESLIERLESFNINSIHGDFEFHTFKQKFNQQIHFALKKGNWDSEESVPVRVVSSGIHNDLFSTLISGQHSDINKAIEIINKQEKGLIVFINNVVNKESVISKVNHFKSFINKETNNPYPPTDVKDLGIGIQIIKNFSIKNIKLITNKTKNIPLVAFGLHIKEYISI